MITPGATDGAFDPSSAQVVFQPVVDLHAWRVAGFEALARFADGSPPPEHLDRASACGRREELELDLIALEIDAAATLPSGAAVTLNASGTTILRPELEDLLSDWDRPWGIELYEGATTADLQKVRDRVTTLGGKLLVDDAGAACADESRISTLRPDVVKIDRALFWEVVENVDAQRRLGLLLDAAREAGAKVLVEGVSSPEHVDLARSLGSDFAQGFHLGVPTPVEGIPALLAELHRSVGMDAPGL